MLLSERKMVYYPSLPLIVKSEHHRQLPQNQLCTPLNGEAQLYHIPQSSQLHLLQQSSQQTMQSGMTNGHQNGLPTALLIPSNNFLQNIKVENLSLNGSTANSQSSFSSQNQNQNMRQSSSPSSISSQQINQNLNGNSINLSRSNIKGTVANKPQFKCDLCGMNFGSKSAHTSHVKSHKKQQDTNFNQNNISNGNHTIGNTLPQNGSTTLSTTTNAQVRSTGGGSDPYQCETCQKTFAVPARLIRHLRTHTGEKPFECEFCPKKFSVKENLQVHRRIHTKERPYKCDVCGRAFEHSGKLHRHMRIHTGERPHKCSICDKTFIQSGQLVIHMRTHTGEKPYKCPVEGCGKGFTCSKQLKVHSRTHTGEKPYHCDICFRDFGYNHVLKLHKVQHYGSKCYKCTICDETFKNKKEMEAHIKGHANELPDDDDPSGTDQSIKSEVSSRQSPSTTPQTHLRKSPQPNRLHQSAQQSLSQTQTSIPQNNYEIKQEPRYRRSIESSCYETESSSNNSPSSPIHHNIEDHNTNTTLMTDNSTEMEIVTELDQTIDYEQSNVSPPQPNGIYPTVYRFNQTANVVGIKTQQQNSPLKVQQTQHPSINPALLAAASIASRRVEESNQIRRVKIPSSPPSLYNESAENSNEEVHVYYKVSEDRQTLMSPPPQRHIDDNSDMYATDYTYEALDALRQRASYFPPAPSVAEYKPSYRNNEIVRQVEAVIVGAGLSPPRSTSTESPERSSSPESDTMLMADRDVMTLPLRKRKLYMSEQKQITKEGPPPVVRMSSVIQFAKAS